MGTIPSEKIEKSWGGALAAVTKEVALPGFRKGHVPKERVIQEVGEDFIWKEAAERVIKRELTEILKQHEVTPIAPLSLMLAPARKGEEVKFEIIAIIAPTVTLGDYKAIVERALEKVPTRDEGKERAEAEKAFMAQLGHIIEKKDGTPLTDNEAKKAGFENAATLQLFIADESNRAVESRAAQARRGAVAEALITAFPADIPTFIITDEAEALANANKQGEAKVDMTPHAEKRIALDLIFSEIVKKEGLKLEGEEDKKAEDDLAHRIMSQGVPHDRAHIFARESLIREKVWEVLGLPAQAGLRPESSSSAS